MKQLLGNKFDVNQYSIQKVAQNQMPGVQKEITALLNAKKNQQLDFTIDNYDPVVNGANENARRILKINHKSNKDEIVHAWLSNWNLSNIDLCHNIRRLAHMNLMNDVTRCDGCNDFLDGYGDHCNNCPSPRMRNPTCLHTTAKKGLIRGLKLLEAEAAKIDDVEITVSNTEPNLEDNGFTVVSNVNIPATLKRADIYVQVNEISFLIDVTTSSPMKISYQNQNAIYTPGKVGKDAEETKRKNYSRYFDIKNLPQNTKFVAFGMDTMGALGPEAIKFIKDICNYFPNDIRAQLKYRMTILLSTYIRRGKRFATEAIRNGLH